MEAVKQGSAAIGLKSKTHAILVALKVNRCEAGKMTSFNKTFFSIALVSDVAVLFKMFFVSSESSIRAFVSSEENPSH